MANNPEFEMQGIRFVIAGPGAQRHPLTFRVRTANGQWVEITHALATSFEVEDVVSELRRLADNLQNTATEWGVRPVPSPVETVQDSSRLPSE